MHLITKDHSEMATLIKRENVVSADIGFGTCTLKTGAGKKIFFRSIVVKCDKGMSNHKDKNGCYLVGNKAINICNGERPSTDTRFFFSDTFRILLMYGLNQLDVKNPTLIIGLPNEFYSELNDEFRKYILSLKDYFQPKDQFNVVTIVRQPQGAVWCGSLKTIDGKTIKPTNTRVAVVDGGDGTTDICEFYQGLMVPGSSTGMSIGASQIHKSMLSHFRTKYEIDSRTNVHDMDLALRESEIEFGLKKFNPRDTVGFKKGVDAYTAEVGAKMHDTWKGYNKVEWVVLDGGVVDVIGQDLYVKRLQIPRHKVLIPARPSEANAEGYLEFIMKYLNSINKLEVETKCKVK